MPGKDVDYLYDDYEEDAESGQNADLTNTLNNSLSPATVVTPPHAPLNIEPPKNPSNSNVKNHSNNNSNAIPVKKNPAIPPSPSSSGFTFFGVPLPNLSFNLWGNHFKIFRKKKHISFIA